MKVLEVSQFIYKQCLGKSFDEISENSKTSMSFHLFEASESDRISLGTVWLIPDDNNNCKLYGTNFDSSG